MAALVTSLSSAGTSDAIVLDPVKKSTTIQYTISAGSSGSAFIQYTLDRADDPATSAVTWAALSSAMVSSAADAAGGVMYTVLSPLGGLRINSTSATSAVMTLKALQAVSG